MWHHHQESREERAARHRRAADELALRNGELDDLTELLYEQLGCKEQQLLLLLSLRDKFTDGNWQQLADERRRLDERLALSLRAVNRGSATATRKRKGPPPQAAWLPMR